MKATVRKVLIAIEENTVVRSAARHAVTAFVGVAAVALAAGQPVDLAVAVAGVAAAVRAAELTVVEALKGE